MKVTEEKDLGVYVTENGKPSKQCVEAARKASYALRTVKRTFSTFDIDSFSHLYKSYVRSQMEYCVQAWNPYLKKDIEILEKIQKRATQLVPGLRNLPYLERLRALNLSTLEERRERGDLIETFKILTGKENVPRDKFFSLNQNITRGNSMKLYKPRLNKSVLQRVNFFSIRIINAWNRLPDHVISAQTTNVFKNRLDKYMKIRHGAEEAMA